MCKIFICSKWDYIFFLNIKVILLHEVENKDVTVFYLGILRAYISHIFLTYLIKGNFEITLTFQMSLSQYSTLMKRKGPTRDIGTSTMCIQNIPANQLFPQNKYLLRLALLKANNRDDEIQNTLQRKEEKYVSWKVSFNNLNFNSQYINLACIMFI